MAQKVLAGRCADPMLSGDLVDVKVDQIVLTRAPMRALVEARDMGLKKTSAEVAIAYDTRCVGGASPGDPGPLPSGELLAHGIVIGRPGIGFPAPVHLERFASPARLCVTDDPRLASVGGIGMLTMVMPPGMLGQALAQGQITLRPPRSVQVLLSGRARPFVCARDMALELVRRGLSEAVTRVEAEHQAPVVIEFAGPSVRLLSVGERAVLAGLAPQLGASAALFVSDERTEVFLRDQRRSKAHRALAPDAGAPCDEVVTVDLGAVDPLYMDESGNVRAVRDLAGKPVSQVVLGGDTGTTLRDLFAAAALLKSKRVSSRVEFLLAVPSRQMLEVLATSGALADLIATGARVIEPDGRLVSGEIYPVSAGGLSARTHDPEPGAGAPKPLAVASAETLSWAVATGEMGDPRSFKRPVRVTIPRALPTDDVLVLRDRKGVEAPAKGKAAPVHTPNPWKGTQTLEIVDGPSKIATGKGQVAVLCASLDEVRELAARAPEIAPNVRAVLASFIPSTAVAVFSGVGIAAIRVEPGGAKGMKGQRQIALPAPSSWAERQPTVVHVGSQKVPLTWLARGAERGWASAGTARSASPRR
ncbi:MAG: aconitase family protein [Polyangiaceae bacterium]